MAFLSRKNKTDAAEFAKSWYEEYVFSAPYGVEMAETIAEVNRDAMAGDAPSFAAVSLPKLNEELLALRLEMIGTAWTFGSKDEASLAVSEATKAYLAALGRLDLWEAMGAYNLAVAEAATAGADPERGTGRARLVMVNKGRMELFKKWQQGRDGEAVARVVNRLHSKGLEKNLDLQGAVALQAIHRLEIEYSEAILIDLAATAGGFYQGAKEALEGVQLTP